MGIHLPQVVDTRHAILAILDRNAEPYILWATASLEILRQSLRALGQNLIGVLRRLPDHREDLIEELIRDIFVKEITHRIDEVDRRLLALQWLRKSFRQYRQLEAILIARSAHGMKPPGHHIGVAVLATWCS